MLGRMAGSIHLVLEEQWERDMPEASTKSSVTSRSIAVEHIRTASAPPFAEFRRKLETTVPRLATGVAQASLLSEGPSGAARAEGIDGLSRRHTSRCIG
jgi:hypothetical protein